ncbi:hypothetical protein HN51_043147 [Arachis hypogaea]
MSLHQVQPVRSKVDVLRGRQNDVVLGHRRTISFFKGQIGPGDGGGGTTSTGSRRQCGRSITGELSADKKQGYCEFFAWFDEIFGYAMEDVVEGYRLASVDTGAGDEGVVSLNDGLEDRVKQLENLLWKKDEDNQFVKKHNIFDFLRGVICGALIGVVVFCIFVVAV